MPNKSWKTTAFKGNGCDEVWHSVIIAIHTTSKTAKQFFKHELFSEGKVLPHNKEMNSNLSTTAMKAECTD